MDRSEEFALKRQRVEEWLAEKGLDGVVLTRTDSFAWLGCGADSFISVAQETGVGTLVVEPRQVTLVANNIEAERLLAEELDGLDIAGTEVFAWHEPARRDAAVSRLVRGRKFVADGGAAGLPPVPGDFVRLRYSLTEAEADRYRSLGADLTAAMESAARSVERGMTEFEAGALLARGCQQVGATPVVLLVAADDRITNWRHPLPTETPIGRCCMIVLCGRRHGLVIAVTRLVHFGELPEDLARRHRAVCSVDAAMISATRPGRAASEVLAVCQRAYEEQGFPDEWRQHHQGGAAGYQPREYLVTPQCTEVVQANQAFAWNPSIRGTKSEDTMLAGPQGHELLTTPSPQWPTVEVPVGNRTMRRADILVR